MANESPIKKKHSMRGRTPAHQLVFETNPEHREDKFQRRMRTIKNQLQELEIVTGRGSGLVTFPMEGDTKHKNALLFSTNGVDFESRLDELQKFTKEGKLYETKPVTVDDYKATKAAKWGVKNGEVTPVQDERTVAYGGNYYRGEENVVVVDGNDHTERHTTIIYGDDALLWKELEKRGLNVKAVLDQQPIIEQQPPPVQIEEPAAGTSHAY